MYVGRHVLTTIATIAICVLSLAGCVKPGTKITSNSDPNYRRSIQRLFVVTTLGPELGSAKTAMFKSTFSQALLECGIETSFFERQPLALDNSAQTEALRKFAPDAAMSMIQSGHNTLTTGYITEVSRIEYALEVVDLSLKKSVWKAKISFEPRADMFIKDNGGEILGKDLAAKMKADGVLRNCVSAGAELGVKPI